MADHRKSFRPRRLAIGGRLFTPLRIVGASLAVLGAVAAAHAEDAGLKNGAAALNAGNYDNAVRLLSSTVNSDSAPANEAAKALYLRGIAHRKLGQPSRAISDLGAAIWLGLPTSDRVRAQVNRGLAYQAAGLSKEAEADFAAARKASSRGEVEKIVSQDGASGAAVAAFTTEVSREGSTERTVIASPRTTSEAPGNWDTSVASGAAQERSGNRVSRWWGSVTDTFSSRKPASQQLPESAPAPPDEPSPEPAPPTRTAAVAPAAAPAATQAAAPSTWSTEVQDAGAPERSGTRLGRWISRTRGGGDSEPEPAPTQTAAAASGGYSLQLANSRSEAEAKALWQQAARANRQLASARPQIEKVDIGNFGTFYSLKAGPFDRAQSQSLCNALKRSSIDCSVVSPDGP